MSFKPSLFTKETHQQSAFHLEGKHAIARMREVPSAGGKEAVYKLNKLQCVECHADPHGAEFSAAPYENRCDACHTQETFKPTTFGPKRH